MVTAPVVSDLLHNVISRDNTSIQILFFLTRILHHDVPAPSRMILNASATTMLIMIVKFVKKFYTVPC